MILVCHVISQDHVKKGGVTWVTGPSWQVTNLPSLVAIGTVAVEIK